MHIKHETFSGKKKEAYAVLCSGNISVWMLMITAYAHAHIYFEYFSLVYRTSYVGHLLREKNTKPDIGANAHSFSGAHMLKFKNAHAHEARSYSHI